jgi:DNA-binding CsgD family transcriptional regulator
VVFDTVRHTNVQKKPAYRRIHRYYKSVGKYKSEKQRRKVIVKLGELGFSEKQIAARLGVSVSTVKRDRRKVSCHCKGKFNAKAFESRIAFQAEFLSWPVKKQLSYLQGARMVREKALRCKALIITVDFDAALSGRYALKFKPHLPVQMVNHSRITFEVAACGRTQVLGRMYVGALASGGLGLHTNDSLKAFIKPVLDGLMVVESKESFLGKGKYEG